MYYFIAHFPRVAFHSFFNGASFSHSHLHFLFFFILLAIDEVQKPFSLPVIFLPFSLILLTLSWLFPKPLLLQILSNIILTLHNQ